MKPSDVELTYTWEVSFGKGGIVKQETLPSGNIRTEYGDGSVSIINPKAMMQWAAYQPGTDDEEKKDGGENG